MKQIIQSCCLAAGLILGASAQAGIITDIVEVNTDLNSTFLLDTVNYTHNLNDEAGFVPGNVLSGTLAIEIFDDTERCEGFLGECLFGGDFETALILVGNLDFDTGGISGLGEWSNILGVNALADVNAGLLNISVTASTIYTDLRVGHSVLTLVTQDVPAPATLALFGLGLLGLGAARKRANKA